MLFVSLSSAACLLRFLLFTCMPKTSSEGQKAWGLSESRQKKAGMYVLLNQTKRARLNRCTPLDRVMFIHVCALLKCLLSWGTVWKVAVLGRCLLGKWRQAFKLAVYFTTFFMYNVETTHRSFRFLHIASPCICFNTDIKALAFV